MIVADTGALVALIDRNDRSHEVLRTAFAENAEDWVLPWAILPEVDYFVGSRLGQDVSRAFRRDLAGGLFTVEWNGALDLERARALDGLYSDLSMGLVDAIVMATAERLRARAIATLDLRDFAPVELKGRPQLWPRDL